MTNESSGTGTARNSAQMSITDWWLDTSRYGRDQSTSSAPSTTSCAPAPPSRPGAHSHAAMRSGRSRRPVIALATSAALMQAAVHSRVNASCSRLNADHPAAFSAARRSVGPRNSMCRMSKSIRVCLCHYVSEDTPAARVQRNRSRQNAGPSRDIRDAKSAKLR